ncbi:sulfatase-like hydrolase/transferase [Mycolicibacterium komossense]|uniref:Sulfatase-like hydrolase/transferase n=1 Tax=Mycolicibacterium komossense TaxID=1779 RepID=A0ABT3CAX7_9MYCO|nr:sulfatase-like hydrolase/transferase [Mycolicibacterium komossense]MCV7226629.1 sulfatase-like hydrolase/transferase [Mycolicibacterium komossense]
MSKINRRTLLTGGGVVAAGTAAFGGYELLSRSGRTDAAASGGNKPNILVVVVDQMRTPQWFPDTQRLDALLPNLGRLRQSSVAFDAHYTASNACTPSRGVMTTGLYSHQTGCLYTGDGPTESSLAPKFPTWGTMLREQGYRTWWWGKWHLGAAADTTPDGLDAHGFAGGTYPSPNGAPNQGLQRDPGIADQFVDWFDAHATEGPWCTTVSLVNPHDIMWWPKTPLPEDVPRFFAEKPPNFETPADLAHRSKPQLQIDYIDYIAPLMAGALAFSGPDVDERWARGLDVYLWLQQQVDHQIGRVLDTVTARPEIDRNTIVVFTSDHGEYGGSHGMRGKGAAIYEEAIRVPLYIRDPSGHLTPSRGDVRTQMTSSVDLAPLLLTIGAGGNGWRSDSRFSHLADRADIAGIAANPAASGRPWIAHVTDDISVEEMAAMLTSPGLPTSQAPTNAPGEVPTSAPSHIVAVRTPAAKFGVYSHWKPGGMDVARSRPVDLELYDYSTPMGVREIDNQAGRSRQQEGLQGLIDHEVLPEIGAPLPAALHEAQELGLANMQQLTAARGG